MSEKLTKEEFCKRFVAYMVKHAGFEKFDDDDEGPGETVAAYAEETAPQYWEDELQSGAGPEESADADMSYWGEE